VLTAISWPGSVSLLPAFAVINITLALFYLDNRRMRRGLISTDLPKGDVTDSLDRITTEYIDTEDRLRLTGQYADGAAVPVQTASVVMYLR